MPANHFGCTHCGAHLKAPAGKAKVRCPGCGAVLTVPSAMFEAEPPRQVHPRRSA